MILCTFQMSYPVLSYLYLSAGVLFRLESKTCSQSLSKWIADDLLPSNSPKALRRMNALRLLSNRDPCCSYERRHPDRYFPLHSL